MRREGKKIIGWQFHDPNVDYVLSMIDRAPRYGVNHIQLSHDMVLQVNEVTASEEKQKGFNEIIDRAHRRGIETYVWSVEMSFVSDKFIRNGHVNLNHSEVWDWLGDCYREFFEKIPEVDGIVVSFGDMSYYHIYNNFEVISNVSKKERIKKIINIIYSVCKEYSKKLILRDWAGGSLAKDAIMAAPKDIIIMTKCTTGDWHTLAEHNPWIGIYKNRAQIIEFDLAGEKVGRSWIPWCVPEYIKYRWKYDVKHESVIGAVGRIDVFDGVGARIYCVPYTTPTPVGVQHAYGTPNEINILAFSRVLENPDVDTEEIWKQWVTEKYGYKAYPLVASALKRSSGIANELFSKRSCVSRAWVLPRLAYLETVAEQEGILGPADIKYFIEEKNAIEELQKIHKPIEQMCGDAINDLKNAKNYLTQEEYQELVTYFEKMLTFSDVWKQMYKTFIRYKVLNRYPSGEQNKLLSMDLDALVELANHIEAKFGENFWLAYPTRIRDFVMTISEIRHYVQKETLQTKKGEADLADLEELTIYHVKKRGIS
jgi:hypothetical protein